MKRAVVGKRATDDDAELQHLLLEAIDLLLDRMLYPPASCDHEGRHFYDRWRERARRHIS